MSDLHELYEQLCSHKQGGDGPHGLRGVKWTSTCDNARAWRDLVGDVSRTMRVDEYTAIAVILQLARATFEANRETLTDRSVTE